MHVVGILHAVSPRGVQCGRGRVPHVVRASPCSWDSGVIAYNGQIFIENCEMHIYSSIVIGAGPRTHTHISFGRSFKLYDGREYFRHVQNLYLHMCVCV